VPKKGILQAGVKSGFRELLRADLTRIFRDFPTKKFLDGGLLAEIIEYADI